MRALPELIPRASGTVFGLELPVVEVLASDGEGWSREEEGEEAEEEGEEEREAGDGDHLLGQLEEKGGRGKRL